MPKIRSTKPRQILQRRSTIGLGAGRGIEAQSRADASLNQGINKIANAAGDVEDTLSNIEAEKMRSEFQTKLNKNLETATNSGEINDPKTAKKIYNDTANEVLGQSSNPFARSKFNSSANSFESRYNVNVQKIQAANKVKEVESNFDKISAESGGRILNASATNRPSMLAAEVMNGKAFTDELEAGGDKVLADRYREKQAAVLQQTYIESGLLEEETAEEVSQALRGKSGSKELNELYSVMDPQKKAIALRRLEGASERISKEYDGKARELIAELGATNALGRKASPGLVSSAISFASKVQDPDRKKEMFRRIRQESDFNAKAVAGVSGKSLQEVNSDLNEYMAGFKSVSAVDELEARNRASRFLQAEVKLRKEDPKAAVDRIEALSSMKNSNDPIQRSKYYNKVVATQEALGMERSVISKDEAAGISAAIEAAPTLAHKAELLDQQIESYGKNQSTALNDLKKRKVLTGSTLTYAYVDDPNAKQRLLRNDKMRKAGELSAEGLKQRAVFTIDEIDKNIRDKMKEYTAQIAENPGLAPLLDSLEESVREDAIAQGVSRNATSASSAVESAIELYVENNFISIDTSSMFGSGSGKIFSPKFPGANEEKIEAFLDVAQDPENIAFLKPDFNPKEFKSAEEFAEQEEDNFFWQTDPSNTDFVRLFVTTTTGTRAVNSDKVPIRVSLKEISNGTDPLFKQVDAKMAPFSSDLLTSVKTNPGDIKSQRAGF